MKEWGVILMNSVLQMKMFILNVRKGTYTTQDGRTGEWCSSNVAVSADERDDFYGFEVKKVKAPIGAYETLVKLCGKSVDCEVKLVDSGDGTFKLSFTKIGDVEVA